MAARTPTPTPATTPRRPKSSTTPLPLLLLLCAAAAPLPAAAKRYERCELAKELRDRHSIPEKQLATWVCIAFHESRFDTAAVGRFSGNSLDHGLFQISDLYWCGASGPGGGCGVACSRLQDDDIADDVRCARLIHREHTRYTGDGFDAWAVYQRGDCTPHRAAAFLEGCSDATTPLPASTAAPAAAPTASPTAASHIPSTTTTATSTTTAAAALADRRRQAYPHWQALLYPGSVYPGYSAYSRYQRQ